MSRRSGPSPTPEDSAWAGSGRLPRVWWRSSACCCSWCWRHSGSLRSTGRHMSNSNPSGDSGDTAWQEYLTGGGHGGQSAGHQANPSASASSGAPEGPSAPRRVIGTPSPATSRAMLPQAGHGGPQRPPRELPPGPEDPIKAKKAERIVATLFILAFLAGLGFIASYEIFGAGSLTKVLRSNLALGGTLSLSLLALAAGAVIWVRNIMPTVDLTEERHLLKSAPKDVAEFKETFEEGTDASQFVKRPILRRTLIAATVPLGVAPIILLRDTGPLPGKSLEHTVWRNGLRLLVYGTNRPITPAEFASPGSIISVVPEGFQNDDDALAKAATVIIKFRPRQMVFPP